MITAASISVSALETMNTLADLRFSLPNCPPNWDVMLRDLLSPIDPRKTSALVVYGSSVRPRRRRKFLRWEWDAGDSWARDVDVLALTDNFMKRPKIGVQVHVREYDDYGSYFGTRRQNLLHVAETSEEIFRDALACRDEVACAILEEGVILAGEFPLELKSGREFARFGEKLEIVERPTGVEHRRGPYR